MEKQVIPKRIDLGHNASAYVREIVMNRNFKQIVHLTVLAPFLAAGLHSVPPQVFASTELSHHSKGSDHVRAHVSAMALQYAKAMAAGQVEEWAALDLGCLARQKKQKSSAQACWDSTMAAHRNVVADEAEPWHFWCVGPGYRIWPDSFLASTCRLLERLPSGSFCFTFSRSDGSRSSCSFRAGRNGV